jgi:hypothetical protein
MSSENKRLARFATLTLAGIETLALYGLLRRDSRPAVVLGLYSPEYVLFLAVCVGAWLATLYLAWQPSARISTWVTDAARWLRKRWWLFVLLAYGALEGWYALILLAKRRLFPDPAVARRPTMTAVLLLIVWVVLVILFAGRMRHDRRRTAGNLGLAVASVALSFWLFSIALVQVFNYKDARDVHHSSGNYLRYDYQLGYRGKPNLQAYEPSNCPAEAEGVTYFTDDQGFRNQPGAEDAPLVVVGDSFVFGTCLPYEDLWTTRLGETLDTEVANYSMVGISLWHYNKYTDVLVREGDHRALIYSVFLNDLVREPSFDESLHARLATNGILYYMSPVNFTIAEFLTQSPARQVYERVITPPAGVAQPPATVALANGVVLQEHGGLYSQYLGPDSSVGERLETAIAYADEMDMALVVVMIPSKRSTYDQAYVEAFPASTDLPERENQAYNAICAWLVDQGTPCYNLTEDLRLAAQEGPALYFTTDGHLNALGSQVAADLIADFLRENLPDDVLDSLQDVG